MGTTSTRATLGVLLAGAIVLALWLGGVTPSGFGIDDSDKPDDDPSAELISGQAPETSDEGPRLRGSKRPPIAELPPSVELPADYTRLHLDVLLPNHTVAPGALIHWWTEDDTTPNRASWIREIPWIRVPEGEIWLQALRRGIASEPRSVDTSRTSSVRLRLRGQPGIRGRIHLPERLETTRASVLALRFEGVRPPDWTRTDQHRKARRTDVRRLEPTYAFPKLEPGRYVVAFAFGRRIDQTAVVDVEDYSVVHDFLIERFSRAAYTPLVIRGLDQAKLNRLKFESDYGDQDGSPARVTVIPRRDGPWLIRPDPGLDAEGMPYPVLEQSHRLVAYVPGRGQSAVTYRPGQQEPIRITFESSVEVVVRFGKATDGQALPPLGALIHSTWDTSKKVRQFRPGRPVRFSLQPGKHTLLLLGGGAAGPPDWFTIRRYPIDVTPSTRELRLRIPALHQVTLVARSDPRKLWLMHKGDQQSSRYPHRVTQQGGTFAFLFVAAGAYEAGGRYEDERRTWTLAVDDDATFDLDG